MFYESDKNFWDIGFIPWDSHYTYSNLLPNNQFQIQILSFSLCTYSPQNMCAFCAFQINQTTHSQMQIANTYHCFPLRSLLKWNKFTEGFEKSIVSTLIYLRQSVQIRYVNSYSKKTWQNDSGHASQKVQFVLTLGGRHFFLCNLVVVSIYFHMTIQVWTRTFGKASLFQDV